LNRVLIVDGDVSCYIACRPRWQDKIKNNTVEISLDENGDKLPLLFSTEEDEKYLRDSWNNLNRDLEAAMEANWCDSMVMAVKSKSNFRDDIYFDYKASRKNSTRPNRIKNDFVPALLHLAVKSELAIESEGREADDFVRIWAEECRRFDIPFVVCTIDKDLDCIAGAHYNPRKKLKYTITQDIADKHYYAQLLQGDSTDDIPGLPGIGPVTATRVIAGLDTIEEYQEEVVSRYIDAFGDDWYSNLLVNGKMIHIQRHMNDYFNYEEWPVVKELI